MSVRTTTGASELAAAMGKHPTVSRYALHRRLLGFEQEANERMFWGLALENVILDAAVLAGHFTLFDRQVRFELEPLHATPDGVTVEGSPVEVKNIDSIQWMRWGHEFPEHYRIQSRCQSFCSGAEFGWLVGLVGGNELVVERIEAPDEVEVKEMQLAAKAALARAAEDRPPDPDGTELEMLACRAAYEHVTESTSLELPADDFELIDEIVDALRREKEAKQQVTAAKIRCMEILGDRETLTWMDTKIASWKANKHATRVWRWHLDHLSWD